jgi:hypothetical protein
MYIIKYILRHSDQSRICLILYIIIFFLSKHLSNSYYFELYIILLKKMINVILEQYFLVKW